MLLACLSRLTSSTLSPLAWTPQPDGVIPWYASAIWISLGKQLWEKRKGGGGGRGVRKSSTAQCEKYVHKDNQSVRVCTYF